MTDGRHVLMFVAKNSQGNIGYDRIACGGVSEVQGRCSFRAMIPDEIVSKFRCPVFLKCTFLNAGSTVLLYHDVTVRASTPDLR